MNGETPVISMPVIFKGCGIDTLTNKGILARHGFPMRFFSG
jgi:hypothetical protein